MTQQIQNSNEILLPKEAASYLKIPETTLQKWRSTGENDIPYVKIGRSVRYRLSDLQAYVGRHVRGLGV